MSNQQTTAQGDAAKRVFELPRLVCKVAGFLNVRTACRLNRVSKASKAGVDKLSVEFWISGARRLAEATSDAVSYTGVTAKNMQTTCLSCNIQKMVGGILPTCLSCTVKAAFDREIELWQKNGRSVESVRYDVVGISRCFSKV